MMKGQRTTFRDKVLHDVQRQRRQFSQYGHLRLPKGLSLFREKPGERVNLDFLPYIVSDPRHPDRDDELGIAQVGSLWYKRPYKLHRGVGANNLSLVCPTSVGQRCPICEYRKKKLDEGADWQDETIRALKPSLRNLYYVVPRDSKEYEAVPHIWDVSHFLFQSFLNDELQEDETRGVFPDLEGGLTLRIRFSEERLGKNTFAKVSRIDFVERGTNYTMELIESLVPLDSLLIVPSYQEVEQKFLEVDVPVNVEEEEVVEDVPIVVESEQLVTTPILSNPDDEEEIVASPLTKVRMRVQGQAQEKIVEPTPVHQPIPPTNQPSADPRQRTLPMEPQMVRKRGTSQPAQSKTETVEPKQEIPAAQTRSAKSDKCPYGYKFGVETDEFEQCAYCEVWDDCMTAFNTKTK